MLVDKADPGRSPCIGLGAGDGGIGVELKNANLFVVMLAGDTPAGASRLARLEHVSARSEAGKEGMRAGRESRSSEEPSASILMTPPEVDGRRAPAGRAFRADTIGVDRALLFSL